MTQHDTLQRFVFENIPVRGEIVHLGRSFEIIKSNHPYPEPVAQLLGQSLAAATLLTNILKFEFSYKIIIVSLFLCKPILA